MAEHLEAKDSIGSQKLHDCSRMLKNKNAISLPICSICRKDLLLEDVCRLHCCHLYHNKCIQNICGASNKIACPICRSETPIEQLAGISTLEKKCDFCMKGDGSKVCGDCGGQILCEVCAQKHLKPDEMKHHKLLGLNDYNEQKSTMSFVQLSNNVCLNHLEDKVTDYCEKCAIYFCSICCSYHRSSGCKVVGLELARGLQSELLDNAKIDLRAKAAMFESYCWEENKILVNVLKKTKEAAFAVENSTKKEIEKLKEREFDLAEILRKNLSRENSTRYKKLQKASTALVKMKKLQAEMEKGTDADAYTQLAYLHKIYQEEIKNLQVPKEEPTCDILFDFESFSLTIGGEVKKFKNYKEVGNSELYYSKELKRLQDEVKRYQAEKCEFQLTQQEYEEFKRLSIDKFKMYEERGMKDQERISRLEQKLNPSIKTDLEGFIKDGPMCESREYGRSYKAQAFIAKPFNNLEDDLKVLFDVSLSRTALVGETYWYIWYSGRYKKTEVQRYNSLDSYIKSKLQNCRYLWRCPLDEESLRSYRGDFILVCLQTSAHGHGVNDTNCDKEAMALAMDLMPEIDEMLPI